MDRVERALHFHPFQNFLKKFLYSISRLELKCVNIDTLRHAKCNSNQLTISKMALTLSNCSNGQRAAGYQRRDKAAVDISISGGKWGCVIWKGPVNFFSFSFV